MLPTEQNPWAGSFVARQIDALQASGVDLETLFVNRRQGGKSVYRRLPSELRSRLKRSTFDVVHVMYGGVMARMVAQATEGIPLVVSFCGTDLMGDASAPLPHRLRAAFGVWCSHRAARRANHIVVKSAGLAAALPKGLDRSRISIIPNGVDLKEFRPMDRQQCRQQLGWDSDRFEVLFSFTETGATNKRLWLAQDAVKALNDRGVAASLRLMGTTPHNEVPLWLNAADAVLLTSISEGSPNIVKEALACNRPVVSVDVGDVADRIGGVAGCYVTPPEMGAIAECLWQVAHGAGSVAGRAAVQDLSVERVAEQLLGVYERVRSRRAERQ
jgi:teichuronic acid biosynthesis glycosyltransferase TuaC